MSVKAIGRRDNVYGPEWAEEWGVSKSDPVLDIIIPVHNLGRWVELCLQAVHSFTKVPYHVIVVDNASTEDYCKKVLVGPLAGNHQHVTVVRNPENKSFSNSINRGVAAGTAPNIVILNDDALVTTGWDEHFLQDLADMTVGMTGARSNYASGRQGMGILYEDAPFLVFVCVGIRRKLWDELGPMDEITYDGFSTEDLDYSYRVRWCVAQVQQVNGVPQRVLQKATKPVRKLRVSGAYVLHAGSQTLQANLGTLQALDANNTKYMHRLETHWGKDFVRENTRVKPKVLVTSFSAEEHTRVNFMLCLMALKMGTGFDFSYEHITRLPIHTARQLAAEKAISGGYDFVMMIDDDMVFAPETLQNLMKHMSDPDVVVVNTLAYGRRQPYHACIFKQSKTGYGYDQLEGHEDRGLIEIDGTGLSCCLIRCSIFEKLDSYYTDQLKPEDRIFDAIGPDNLGKLEEAKFKGHRWWRPLSKLEQATFKGSDWFGHFEKLGEDLFFCHRVKDAGFKIHCDTNQVIGHIGEPEIVGRRVKQAFVAGQARVSG